MKLKSLIAFSVLWICACAAHAQTPGRFLLSAGVLYFSPKDNSGLTENTNLDAMMNMNHAPVFGLDDSKMGVFGGYSAGIAATYFLTEHWAGEFMLGMGPELNLYGAGKWSPMGKLGTFKQWSPIFLLKYYFFDETCAWRPYVGIGASRPWFRGAYFDNALFEGSFGDSARLRISPKHSWNSVFSIGVMHSFDKYWFVEASLSYMPLRATVNITSKMDIPVQETLKYQTPIRISPVITSLRFGYRF